ncbi:phage protein Gp37 [uncultured Methylophaga sp.]|uniref:phage protein Gp37 n=1 Tax=uncultured Methylophaga sp. TaxID=285271 RepID=UPI0026252EEA|nr:phage protein Gp37 [uncultured Methylophaga sp.]
MNPIVAVEDHMKTEAAKVVGQKIRLDSLPSALNVGLLKKLINSGDAVYFTFLGGPVDDEDGARVNGRFDAYVIVRHVGNWESRRRGDNTTIGAYEIVSRLVKQMHDSVVADIGSIKAKRVSNLFSIQLEEAYGAALYAITFEVPGMPFLYEADLDAMDDFITFDAQHDIPPHDTEAEHQDWLQEPPDYTDSQPDAQDTVTDLNQ